LISSFCPLCGGRTDINNCICSDRTKERLKKVPEEPYDPGFSTERKKSSEKPVYRGSKKEVTHDSFAQAAYNGLKAVASWDDPALEEIDDIPIAHLLHTGAHSCPDCGCLSSPSGDSDNLKFFCRNQSRYWVFHDPDTITLPNGNMVDRRYATESIESFIIRLILHSGRKL
jgi:hypothetical protein